MPARIRCSSGHIQLHPGLLQLDLTGGALDLDLVGLQDPITVLILGLDLGRLQEGVLELELRVEADAVVELMAEVDHEPVEIHLVRLDTGFIVVQVVVVQLAVAANPSAIDPARRGLGFLLGRFHGLGGGFDLLLGGLDAFRGGTHLALGLFELRLQLVDGLLLGLDDPPHLLGARRSRRPGSQRDDRRGQEARHHPPFKHSHASRHRYPSPFSSVVVDTPSRPGGNPSLNSNLNITDYDSYF